MRALCFHVVSWLLYKLHLLVLLIFIVQTFCLNCIPEKAAIAI